MQVGIGRAAPQPAPLGELEAADALLAGAVEVRVVLVSGPAGSLEVMTGGPRLRMLLAGFD